MHSPNGPLIMPTFSYDRFTDQVPCAINRIQAPDLNAITFVKRLSVTGVESQLSYPFTGFTLEETFRMLGALDFDLAVTAAENIEDRRLRARAVLALASHCLKEPKSRSLTSTPWPTRPSF